MDLAFMTVKKYELNKQTNNRIITVALHFFCDKAEALFVDEVYRLCYFMVMGCG